MNTFDWNNATPEQHILWNHVRTLIAYTTITPLCFEGAIAGSEFLTYNAGKLYMALQITLDSSTSALGLTAYLRLYDLANAFAGDISCGNAFFDTVAANSRGVSSSTPIKNIYFSRFTNNGIQAFSFIGYRLTV